MQAFHHVAVSTPNLDKLVSFYIENFGAIELFRNQWGSDNENLNLRFGLSDASAKVALLKIADAHLEVFQFSSVSANTQPHNNWRHGYTHFCLQVDSCSETYDRLRNNGVEFAAPPLTMPIGATFAYARDPDGNTIEILEVPQGIAFPSRLYPAG